MSEKITEIKLGINTRKKFKITDLEDKIIELDVNDLNISKRIDPAIAKIEGIKSRWQELIAKVNIEPNADFDKTLQMLEDSADGKEIKEIFTQFEAAEAEMREAIDYLFDSPVSEVIFDKSSAFSAVNGSLKCDVVIQALSELYQNSIKSEIKKLHSSKSTKYAKKYLEKK